MTTFNKKLDFSTDASPKLVLETSCGSLTAECATDDADLFVFIEGELTIENAPTRVGAWLIPGTDEAGWQFETDSQHSKGHDKLLKALVEPHIPDMTQSEDGRRMLAWGACRILDGEVEYVREEVEQLQDELEWKWNELNATQSDQPDENWIQGMKSANDDEVALIRLNAKLNRAEEKFAKAKEEYLALVGGATTSPAELLPA